MNVTGDLIQKSCIFEWKVYNFLSFQGKVGDFCCSPDFEFGRGTWCIKMYPNGYEQEDTGCISLFLYKLRSQFSKHVVSFEMSIKDKDGQNYKSRRLVKCEFSERGWGWGKFVFRNKLLQEETMVIPEDVLIISCSVSWYQCVTEAVQQTTDPSLQDAAQHTFTSSVSDSARQTTLHRSVEKMTQDLKNFFLDEDHKDVTLKVKNREFRAHRSILIARCPVFCSMFKHNLTENSTGIVDITDCDPDAFYLFLLYLYSGSTDEINASNVLDLYSVADKYGVQELQVECIEFMQKELSVDNFGGFMALAVLHNESAFIERASYFFRNNLKKIVVTVGWQTFLKENPTDANELYIKVLNYLIPE